MYGQAFETSSRALKIEQNIDAGWGSVGIRLRQISYLVRVYVGS